MLLLAALMILSEDPCRVSSPSMADMRACNAQELKGVDRQLAISWQRALGRAQLADRLFRSEYGSSAGSADWAEELKQSQIGWNRYRDAQCRSESNRMRPGNGTIGTELNCRIRIGKARIVELDKHFD